jgi:hypothetical protein
MTALPALKGLPGRLHNSRNKKNRSHGTEPVFLNYEFQKNLSSFDRFF